VFETSLFNEVMEEIIGPLGGRRGTYVCMGQGRRQERGGESWYPGSVWNE
jgi:hypothetical protein